jgi:hypothetical protein
MDPHLLSHSSRPAACIDFNSLRQTPQLASVVGLALRIAMRLWAFLGERELKSSPTGSDYPLMTLLSLRRRCLQQHSGQHLHCSLLTATDKHGEH